jgi:hypothetical protein
VEETRKLMRVSLCRQPGCETTTVGLPNVFPSRTSSGSGGAPAPPESLAARQPARRRRTSSRSMNASLMRPSSGRGACSISADYRPRTSDEHLSCSSWPGSDYFDGVRPSSLSIVIGKSRMRTPVA